MGQILFLHAEVCSIANTVFLRMHSVLEIVAGDLFWEASGNTVIDFRRTVVVFYIKRIYFHWGIILETLISIAFLLFLPQESNHQMSTYSFLSLLYCLYFSAEDLIIPRALKASKTFFYFTITTTWKTVVLRKPALLMLLWVFWYTFTRFFLVFSK